MKPGINIISVFEQQRDENGTEFYTGTLDLKTLKKNKADELHVVMMTGDVLPASLHTLMGKKVSDVSGLFMFVEENPIS